MGYIEFGALNPANLIAVGPLRVKTGPNGGVDLRSALPPIADYKCEAGGYADEERAWF